MTKTLTRKRVVYKIQLTRDAKSKLVELGDRLGVPQSTIMARALGWFCKNTETVRNLILGLIPEQYAPLVARAELSKLD